MDWTGQRARNRGGVRQRGEKKGRVSSQKHIFIFVCSKHFFQSSPSLIFILYLSLIQPPSLFAVICLSLFCGQLQFTFSRERRTFGLPVCFSDSAAEAQAGLVNCGSYQDSSFRIKRLQQDCSIQAIPQLRSSSAQTQWYFSAHSRSPSSRRSSF